ncbi:MAG: thioredoxin family protein [Actinomycetota bacterium]|nr:thioredoxin family protein [Actinomycetota bacterium]MDD5667484.1 thioredoxin family protein [Actinomycetota bacterium]
MALVQSLVEGKEDVIAFREIDVSRDLASADRYRIQVTPTVIILDATGKEVETFVGIPDEEDVSGAIDEAVSP